MYRTRIAAIVAVATASLCVFAVAYAPEGNAAPAPVADRPSTRCPSPPPGKPVNCDIWVTPLATGATLAEDQPITAGRAHSYAGLATGATWYGFAAVSTEAGFDADIHTGQYPKDHTPASSSTLADPATGHRVDWSMWGSSGLLGGTGWIEADVVSHQPAADGTRGGYLVQFAGPSAGLPVNAPGTAVPLGRADGGWIVDLRQVQLAAHQRITLSVTGNIQGIYIVRRAGGDEFTWQRSKSQASAAKVLALNSPGSLSYIAPEAGSYGVVFEARDQHGTGTVRVAVS